MQGVKTLVQQEEEANKYNRMTAAQKVELAQKAAQLKQQQVYQQFEMNKPFPMGQTMGPLGLPMTTYGKFDKDGNVVPAAPPQQGEQSSANPQILNDDSVKIIAQDYRAGNSTALSGLGYGQIGAVNRAKVWNEISRQIKAAGGDGRDLAAAHANFLADTAGARTAATREANVGASVAEAQQTFPLALDASNNLPRSSFVPWNKAVQAFEAGTSDPQLTRYVTALRGAITAYSQALSRTGVNTVHAQEAAETLLNQASGPEGIKAALDQMQKEMQAANLAPAMVRDAITARITGKPVQSSAPYIGGSSPQAEKPPVEGAKKAPDGKWYVPDPNRPGKYLEVTQ
jgi:hypothetical protein